MVWKRDSLLLGKRINAQGENTWQFPGGHLETGESVTACAEREVLEETGLSISNVVHAGFSNVAFTSQGRHCVTLFISADYYAGEAKVVEPDKCECWNWFRYDKLPSPLFLPITNFLKQYPDLQSLRNGLDTQAAAHK